MGYVTLVVSGPKIGEERIGLHLSALGTPRSYGLWVKRVRVSI